MRYFVKFLMMWVLACMKTCISDFLTESTIGRASVEPLIPVIYWILYGLYEDWHKQYFCKGTGLDRPRDRVRQGQYCKNLSIHAPMIRFDSPPLKCVASTLINPLYTRSRRATTGYNYRLVNGKKLYPCRSEVASLPWQLLSGYVSSAFDAKVWWLKLSSNRGLSIMRLSNDAGIMKQALRCTSRCSDRCYTARHRIPSRLAFDLFADFFVCKAASRDWLRSRAENFRD